VQANHMIEQAFEFVGEHEKYSTLTRLLEREMDGSRLLIFCETKRGCDSVTRQLRTEGWPALSIHGDKSQQERDWVLAVRPSFSPVPSRHLHRLRLLCCGPGKGHCLRRTQWQMAHSAYAGIQGWHKPCHACNRCCCTRSWYASLPKAPC
jgi:hypothetical protein